VKVVKEKGLWGNVGKDEMKECFDAVKEEF
jgi:hypothetical protein